MPQQGPAWDSMAEELLRQDPAAAARFERLAEAQRRVSELMVRLRRATLASKASVHTAMTLRGVYNGVTSRGLAAQSTAELTRAGFAPCIANLPCACMRRSQRAQILLVLRFDAVTERRGAVSAR